MFTEQEVQSTTKRALDLGECREPGEAEKNPKLAEAKKSRAQSSGSEPRVLLREECSRGSPLHEQRSRGQSGTALANSQRTAQGAAWEGSRFKRLRLSYVYDGRPSSPLPSPPFIPHSLLLRQGLIMWPRLLLGVRLRPLQVLRLKACPITPAPLFVSCLSPHPQSNI